MRGHAGARRAVAGGVAYLLFRPNPCEGTNFTSANFGYYLTVSEGWNAEQAKVGSDELSAFADHVRQKEEQAGLTPGPAEPVKVDSVAAQRWDMTKTTDSGQESRMREVVVVRDDVGWRITLSDLSAAFADTAAPFNRMLGSWRFR